MSSDEDLVREEREMLVLLYEFPAETRLTVYRRLDMKPRTKKKEDIKYRLWSMFASIMCLLITIIILDKKIQNS